MKRLVTSKRLLRQVFYVVSILILLTALARGQDLFVAEENNVYKFAPSGTRSTFASGLDEIWSLACDKEGNLFVSSGISYNSNLYKFTPDGTRSTFASGHPFYGMAFNSAGNLFAADSGGIIYQFTPSGANSIFASGVPFSLTGLACDSEGNLFVSLSGIYSNNIYKVKPDGACETFASGVSAMGLACDSVDNLFVVDNVNERILKFTPDGTRSTFASGLYHPRYLAFQPIPEPTTLLLFGFGSLALLRKRRK